MEPWSVENDVCPGQLPKSWTNNRANIPSLMFLNLGFLISKSMDTDVFLFCIYRTLLELDYGYQCRLCEMCLGLREPPLFSLNPTLPLSLICPQKSDYSRIFLKHQVPLLHLRCRVHNFGKLYIC